MGPDPFGEQFARRVFQTGHFIQITVIKCLMDGVPGLFDIGEVHDPAKNRVKGAADMHLDDKGMSMHPSTGMPLLKKG